ncbi:hypothetical protein F8388_014590 [Cannabis sativa]|uniref:RING-type E3 ubiquitin transferase n=1 Tax=Cannabis sativa TaxID=3483 RepID=A0A7J6EKR4_CANSA|nr:hypothetical protein F8388_014590 [Cannabis sativa]
MTTNSNLWWLYKWEKQMVFITFVHLLLLPAVLSYSTTEVQPPESKRGSDNGIIFLIEIGILGMIFMGLIICTIYNSLKRGIGKKELDKHFPTINYSDVRIIIGINETDETHNCGVCMSRLLDHEKMRIFIPKCDHVFHADCIDNWLKNHRTCPLCRVDFLDGPDNAQHRRRRPPDEIEMQSQSHVIVDIVDELQEEQLVTPVMTSTGGGFLSRITSPFLRSRSTTHVSRDPEINAQRSILNLTDQAREDLQRRRRRQLERPAN